MSVFRRKLFNRGGYAHRGTGITSGLTPVQRFQGGGQATIKPEMLPTWMTFMGNLASGKSYKEGFGGAMDILGQAATATAPVLAEGMAAAKANETSDDEYFWAYNTSTGKYDRVNNATFIQGVHTKEEPKTKDVKLEWAWSIKDNAYVKVDDATINANPGNYLKDPPEAVEKDERDWAYDIKNEMYVKVTDQEIADNPGKYRKEQPPTKNYKASDVDVFTKDNKGEFTVPNQLTKFTSGDQVKYKDSNNNIVSGNDFIFRGGDAEDNMWVYNIGLGYNEYIASSDYNPTMHRKEAPEKLKGFEYQSIDDIDGKKYAIFVNPNLTGADSVRKVEIGSADPETVKSGSVLSNTFQGLDGYEYEKYVDPTDGLVKARKIPGQLAPTDGEPKYEDKPSVEGTVTIGGKNIPVSFTQTPDGYTIVDPLKTSPTFGQDVLLSQWLIDNNVDSFNMEPNVAKEMNSTELLQSAKDTFNQKEREKFVTAIFDIVRAEGGMDNRRKIEDNEQLLSMVDLTTTGSYADQRNALVRFLDTFGLDDTAPDLFARFVESIKGGNMPATEVVSALSKSGVLSRAMEWAQQLNKTEVGLLINAGNQLFLSKEGQKLLATINLKDAEIKQDAYNMYVEGMKNNEDMFALAVKVEEFKDNAYNEFGNSAEMVRAVAEVKGFNAVNDGQFFITQPDITIEGKTINFKKKYDNGQLVFGGYASAKTGKFMAEDGTEITILQKNLPIYYIRHEGQVYLRQFDPTAPD